MKKSIYFLAAIAMLASCSETSTIQEEEVVEDTYVAQELSFTTSINSLTKATDSNFESSDVIAVTAYDATGTLIKEAAQYTYNGSLFTSTDPIIYDVDGATYTFYSVYPTVSTIGTSLDFYAKSDQSAEGSYEASDILFASLSSSATIPSLSFYHKMSSIVLNIIGDSSGTISMNGKTGLRLGVTTGSTSVLGDNLVLTPASNGTSSYKVIVAPQTMANGFKVATYTVGTVVYDWVLDADTVFESGKQYIFNWTLASREITLETVINGWDVQDSVTIESK